ncbi:MAG: SPOR domain-containing protein [Azonexus sp.]|jgi:cell division protein FtsN|nr:SPOR domain-containing protein [Azonexus sp.]
MSRDLKPKKPRSPQKKSGGGTLVGMFIGLVLGVVIAAGVVWYMNNAPVPFANKAATNGAAPNTGEPIVLPGKPGDPPPEKRFDFYEILPGDKEAVPGTVVRPPEAPKDEGKKETAPKDESATPLFLQAGSFSTAQDADNQKAKLAFMGVEAAVQQVMIQERTFYRVRIGPYTRTEDLNKVRADLARSGIEAQLVR